MKRFSEQFNTKAKTIRLSMAEKRELRDRLVSYMEYHPRAVDVRTHDVRKNISAYYGPISAQAKRVMKWSFSFACFIILSVSYLAEQAIPGDALYAIKIGFNEELRSTLVRGSYEKVVWETQLLNRRIAEARLLASEGRLTEEVEAQVASAVKEHSDNARKEIETLKLSDRDEATLASIELTTALDVQTTSLRNRGNAEPEGQSTGLIETVLAASQEAERVSEESSLPAYDRLLAKVESETTRAYELLEGINSAATLDEQTDIERRLQDIERKMSVAMETVSTDEVLAREELVAALQQTHRLIVFMTNIDVRASLTVNEIVPVTLTEEERVLAVKQQNLKTEALIALVEASLSATSTVIVSPEILEKAQPAIKESANLYQESLKLLLESPLQIDALETTSRDAFNLINDTATLLEITASSTTDVLVPDTEEVGTTTDSTEEEIEGEEVGTTTDSTEEIEVVEAAE